MPYADRLQCFGAFPIVYQQYRGWSAGIGGLAFLGVAVGMLMAVGYSVWANKRYGRISDEYDGFAPPEARLPLCMVGSVAVPIGLFWFAWTNYPSIHWIVSIMAGAPFGFGMVLIFLGIMNYLIDAYTIFAASVLAANSVLRSLFGAAFPLFTTQMYNGLGIHWASSIPAFLALICVPFPFIFYKYGPTIRQKCKYAAQSEKFMREMQQQYKKDDSEEKSDFIAPTDSEEAADEDNYDVDGRRPVEEVEHRQSIVESEKEDESPQFAPIRTIQSRTTIRGDANGYDGNPFDLDRVNTRESFKPASGRSRAGSRASSKSGRSRK